MRSAMSVLIEKTVSVVFLFPMPVTAIFSSSYSSCAERTMSQAKCL